MSGSHLGLTQTRWVRRSNPRSVWNRKPLPWSPDGLIIWVYFYIGHTANANASSRRSVQFFEVKMENSASTFLTPWPPFWLYMKHMIANTCGKFYYVNKGAQYSLFQEVTPFILDHRIKKKEVWKDK